MKILTEKEFEESIKKGVCLVDFFATWCGPCRMMSPILEDVAKKVEGKANVFKVDVDECENLARKFGVMSIPTLILFKDGKQVEKKIGLTQAESLVELIDSNI